MSSEKKAIKALLKSFKKVKSISLVDKVTDAGKTISSFLFQVESKEGKKSKLEQWMEKLEEEKEPKDSKKKEKASDKKKSKDGKLDEAKLEDKKSKDKKSEGKKLKGKKSDDGKKEEGKLKDGKKNKEIMSANADSPAKAEPDPKKPEPEQTKATKAPVKDSIVEKKASHDLKLIEGVGPAVEKILVEAGYGTFDKLAKADSPKLMDLLLEKGGPRYKMFDPTTWPQQAALASEGKMDELKAMQLVLKGGAK